MAPPARATPPDRAAALAGADKRPGGGVPEGALTVHASCVAAGRRAVLIRGASGSGKSALALQLMALGAELVADDRTCLWRDGAHLMAGCPPAISGRIEARGVGILAAPPSGPRPVALIVDLDRAESARLPPDRHEAVLGRSVAVAGRAAGLHFPAAIMLYLKQGRVA